jgi:hypothetical protein
VKRSPLATLLRVAELQEAVARGAAGKALLQARAADEAHAEQVAQLRAAGLAGGTPAALVATTQVRLWRAAAAADPAANAATADGARDAAVARWTEARRTTRLFEELAARKHAEREAAQEKAAQRLADDLAGLRKGVQA